MVATTTTWAIPYAQSTDPFCDGAEITQAMAERIDEILDGQDVALAAFQRPAYASISVTQASLPTVDTRVQYDTTDEDTANLVDLALDKFSIYPNQDGIWISGNLVASSSTASSAAEVWNGGRGYDLQTLSQDQSIREDTSSRSVSALSAAVVFSSAGDDYRMDTHMQASGVPPNPTNIFRARFWVWRYSDLP